MMLLLRKHSMSWLTVPQLHDMGALGTLTTVLRDIGRLEELGIVEARIQPGIHWTMYRWAARL